MTDAIILGEALIDFVPTESGLSLADVPGFYRRFGGAPANVSLGLAKLGTESGFIGKVGNDSFGDFLERRFVEAGVDVSQLYRTNRTNTTLAFVSLTEEGDRDFIFYRNPGPDELLRPGELDYTEFGYARLFHFGSLLLTRRESRKVTEKAIEASLSKGLTVSMDPNIRLNLWCDHSRARKLVRTFLRKVDIVKLSEEEVYFLTGEDDLETGTEKLAGLGPDPVVVTLGKRGCLVRWKDRITELEGFSVKVKDTTGAGDGFMAGFLHRLMENTEDLSAINREDLLESLRFGNATGALTTTDYGATSAFPAPAKVEQLLSDF